MQAERWRQVEELYQAVVNQEEEQRAAFLERSCVGAPDLRSEVESLLAYARKTGKFIDRPALQVVAESLTAEEDSFRSPAAESDNMIGKRIGQYRIVAKLASGGMGDVFRAVRADDEYEKQVALKLVSEGRNFGLFISRFRNERQILATLDHPNITRLLDGGTTDDGTPYFVMELIEGLPIDEYCGERHLSIEARLRLFMEVCSAVQYAHQRLIIHRDIKPGNILVTSEGVPKLMDFGIAKVLNQDEDNPQNATITALRVFTPGYASPEQIKGEPITTASDVYSLGVVLYELLAGRSPYRVTKQAPYEMARAVCEIEPEKPSTAALRSPQSANHSVQPGDSRVMQEVSPNSVRKHLRGDLDNIVLMALRKEPQRRYASVEQFREDVRRHLENLPVTAQNDTLGYRTSKFIRRHKAGVAAAAVVFVLLLTALALTLREAHVARVQQMRAQQRFNDVRELANSLMFDVHDSIKDLAGATPARKLLVAKALQYLEKLSQESAGDASLQNELATAYEKIGDVQGNPNNANLGDTSGALDSYRKAMALRESATALTGSSDETLKGLSSDYQRLAAVLGAVKDLKAALEYSKKNVSIQEQLAAGKPDVASQNELGGAYFILARCYARLQDPKSALENYRKSAAILEPIAQGSLSARAYLAGTYGYMAPIVWAQGDLAQAITIERKSLEILQRLYELDPSNATRREFRDEAYYWTGFYLEQGADYPQALVNYRNALADFRLLAAKDPQEVRIQRYVGICHRSIGTSLIHRGQYAEGLRNVREALSVVQELPRAQYFDEVADTYDSLGFAYSESAKQHGISEAARAADWERARAAYQKSLDMYLELQSHGGVTTFAAGNPARLKGEVARCDAALAKLRMHSN